MKKLTVVIPAYNEEESIKFVINSVPKRIGNIKVSVVVVDDGSTDQTVTIAKIAGALVVSHSQNYGVGKAFQSGLNKALEMNADYMVNIDADGQFDPKEIHKLLKPIISGKADYVISDRFSNGSGKLSIPLNMPKEKYYGNIIMSAFISILAEQKFYDVSCGFRAYSRKAMLMLDLMGKFTYTQESIIDLAAKGLQIASIPVKVRYFPSRKSKIANNLFMYTLRTLKIIFRTFRDYRPFLFFFYVSIIPLIISVLSGVFLATHFYRTGSFTPYKIVGFIFIYFSASTFGLWALGFMADMFTRLRIYQEKMLYYQKLNYYNK